jgi:hypothetical protein
MSLTLLEVKTDVVELEAFLAALDVAQTPMSFDFGSFTLQSSLRTGLVSV